MFTKPLKLPTRLSSRREREAWQAGLVVSLVVVGLDFGLEEISGRGREKWVCLVGCLVYGIIFNLAKNSRFVSLF